MNIEHPTPAQIPQLRALWKEAFGDPDSFLDIFFETAFAPERCMCVVDGKTVAAAAYWFACGDRAYIYAVATAKSHRGRGLCHALMAAIHDLLTRQGYLGAIVVPGEESLRKFYGSMGYADFGGIRQWQCRAGTSPAVLHQVSAEEFAALRRQFLPEGSVLQEKENLAYLSRWAGFYAGEDFLVTATVDGESLYAMELLGNPAAAEGIVAALGAKEGTFRAPGKTAFAMHKPLAAAKTPTYFGFAFD